MDFHNRNFDPEAFPPDPKCGRPAAGPWVLTVAILGSSMVFIDGTVVNVALPALQFGLRATIGDVQWVVEAYTLFLAALLLTGGSLGDLFSLRKVFAAGVILFAAASAWCGLAPNIGQLIAARCLQGMGGALLVPGSLALISVSFSSDSRGRAIGTWSGFTSITTATTSGLTAMLCNVSIHKARPSFWSLQRSNRWQTYSAMPSVRMWTD